MASPADRTTEPTAKARPRRSCLSVPGSAPKMLRKASSLPADEIMFDLEDSVTPDQKEAARAGVIAALREGDWGSRPWPSASTPWTRAGPTATSSRWLRAPGELLDCVIARRTQVLGYDGKWVLHPGQIEPANEVYTPTQAAYDRAEEVLDAYERATTGRCCWGRDDRRGVAEDGRGDGAAGARCRPAPALVATVSGAADTAAQGRRCRAGACRVLRRPCLG